MNKLETNFTLDNNNFTQLKRTDTAALYKRETPEGTLVSYEVFAVKTKDGSEVYPNSNAFGGNFKWAWAPISQDRANVLFDRLANNEVVVPDVDPITGEMNRPENDPSLEEVLASEDPTPVQEIVNEPPVGWTEIPAGLETPVVSETPAVLEDPTVVETPSVDVTPDGGAVVTVAKVKKEKVIPTMNIPSGEFTQAEFARANGLPERGVVWSRLDSLVQAGKLSKVLKQIGKGRPKAFFTEIVGDVVSTVIDPVI